MKVSLYGLFPPNIGGVSIHVHRLSKRMLHDNILSIVYVNNYDKFGLYEYPNYCVDVSIKHRWSFIGKMKWIRVMKKDPADIFHLHGSLYWDFVYVFVLVVVFRKSIVFSVHDQMQLNKSIICTLLCKLLYMLVPKSRLHFIAVNPIIETQLINIGIDKDNIFVIPAFIQDDDTAALDIELVEAIDDSIILLLYAPSLHNEGEYEIYGIPFAIIAFSHLLKLNKYKVKMILCVPNGINHKLYNSILKDSEIPSNNLLLFEKPVSNMAKLLESVDIYIRPTITDGDSVLVREAIAANCVVLTSDAVARPKGVFLYKTGDLNDFLCELINIIKNIYLITNNENKEKDYYSKIISVYKNIDQ